MHFNIIFPKISFTQVFGTSLLWTIGYELWT